MDVLALLVGATTLVVPAQLGGITGRGIVPVGTIRLLHHKDNERVYLGTACIQVKIAVLNKSAIHLLWILEAGCGSSGRSSGIGWSLGRRL